MGVVLIHGFNLFRWILQNKMTRQTLPGPQCGETSPLGTSGSVLLPERFGLRLAPSALKMSFSRVSSFRQSCTPESVTPSVSERFFLPDVADIQLRLLYPFFTGCQLSATGKREIIFSGIGCALLPEGGRAVVAIPSLGDKGKPGRLLPSRWDYSGLPILRKRL